MDHLIALCTNGVSVMTGKNSGVAAKLKDLNRNLFSIHRICQKQSLSCCNTNEGLAYVQEVERWLFQVIVLDVGVQGTNDDTQLFNSVEEKVENPPKPWSCQILMLRSLITALTLSFHKLQKSAVSFTLYLFIT